MRARVTVRTNLQQLIGGATEETIIARVGEGIVSAIGSADDHMQVLENPDRISKAVLARQLDSQHGVRDRLDRHRRHRRGREHRRPPAGRPGRGRHPRGPRPGRRPPGRWPSPPSRSNIAQIEENRAKLVEAEAEVPKAMAEAFRTGRLGILDYYKLRNVQADTDMRRAIAGAGSTGGGIASGRRAVKQVQRD